MTAAELIVRLRATGADSVTRAVADVQRGLHAAGDAAEKARERMRAFTSQMELIRAVSSRLLGGVGVLTGAFGLLNGALGALTGNAAFQAAVKFDSLARGLATVSTNAGDLRAQLGSLQQVAELPGLDFEQAVQGALRLENVGLSASLAQRALAGFGNAVASAGGGADALDGITTALTQIIGKGQVFAEELQQIAERAPVIRRVLVDAFGTADTQAIQALGVGPEQFIARVVAQLEKLPRVSGGVANDLENFRDRVQRALLPLGQGLIEGLRAVTPFVNGVLDAFTARMQELGAVIAAVAKSGLVERFLTPLLDGLNLLNGADFVTGLVNGIATVSAAVLNLPTVFGQARAYAVDLFQTLGSNVKAFGGFIVDVFKAAGANVVQLFQRIGQAISTTFDNLQGLIGNKFRDIGEKVLPLLRTLQSAGKNSLLGLDTSALDGVVNGLTALSALPRFQPRALPDLFQVSTAFPTLAGSGVRPLPNLPDFAPLAGRDEIAAAIFANLKPLDLLPDGLTFGGRQGGQRQTLEPVLNQIADNTRKVAINTDPTSLRRAALGGGVLAQLGVTPAELFGGPVASGARPPSGGTGRVDRAMRDLIDALRLESQRDVIARVSRAAGAGFNPR
jgi:tape measure domain-containing protein